MELNIVPANNESKDVSVAKSELHSLNTGLHGQASQEDERKTNLMRHLEVLSQRNRGFLDRLALNKDEKALLKTYSEKQLEAADVILSGQNKALSAVCDAQVSFVKEVVNTMLKTGRSGLKSAAAGIYRENALSMQTAMDRISSEFYTLIEKKYLDAEKRLPFIQKQILSEIEMMMVKWQQDFELIQNDFSTILQEKV